MTFLPSTANGVTHALIGFSQFKIARNESLVESRALIAAAHSPSVPVDSGIFAAENIPLPLPACSYLHGSHTPAAFLSPLRLLWLDAPQPEHESIASLIPEFPPAWLAQGFQFRQSEQ
jgi:hypothetical protein